MGTPIILIFIDHFLFFSFEYFGFIDIYFEYYL